MKMDLQFFGGRGAGSVSASAPTPQQRQAASREISSMRAPSMGQSRTVEFDGMTATITRVNPGYRSASGSNTMFSVDVSRGGESIFRTNRRGSNAFAEAKDDLRQHLGL